MTVRGISSGTTHRRKILRSLWIVLLAVAPLKWAFSENLYVFDFHGVIVETRADRVGKDGGFPQRFRLFRNFIRSNNLQKAPDGPATVDVTPAELEKIEKLIARADGRPGTLNRSFKTSQGVEFIPGEYHLRTPDSYFRFHEDVQGQNHLLEALNEAEARDPSGKSWRGRFWDMMVQVLSKPETAKSFCLVSASGHSRREWMEFFQALKDKGYIQNLPDADLMFSVSRREYDRYSLTFDSTQQKTELLEDLALQLGRKPLAKGDLRTDPDGRGFQGLHSMIVIEDRPEIVESVAHMFRRLATGRVVPVKFGIFNGGTESEVRALSRPQFTIITSTGLYREASPKEIWGETHSFSSSGAQRACANALRKAALRAK